MNRMHPPVTPIPSGTATVAANPEHTLLQQALSTLCDSVLDINPVTGQYEHLAIRPCASPCLKDEGDYTTALDALCTSHVDRACQQVFRDTFALAPMLLAFDHGTSELEMAYTLHTDKGTLWKNRLAFPCVHADGSRHILVCDRDSTKASLLEEQTKQEEHNYRRVLQNSYAAIYEVDLAAHTFRVIHSSPGRAPFREDAGEIKDGSCPFSDSSVHPKDRVLFLQHYDTISIRAALSSGKELTAEYRTCNEQGQYSWTASLILPMIGDSDRTLILCRDITRQKELDAQRNLEDQRFSTALRNVYTEIYEINLLTDIPRLLFSTSTMLIPADTNKAADLDEIAATLIHPADRGRFLHGNSGVNAQKRFTEGVDEVPVECRRLGRDGTYYWVSSSLVPLRTSTGEATRRGLILVRDITERKQQEQQQRVTEQYDRALRNIYDELYELNVTQDSYRIVYHVQNKYVTPPDSGRLSTVIESVRTNMIHPDDNARFQQFLDIDTVRATFAAGRECLIGEFRKLWKDGAFHWSTLTLFPVGACASDEIYLVFIMDIGEKKKIEELTQRNHLLEQQRLADERYRIIIDQTGTLVFEWCRDGNERFVSPEIPKRFAGNYNGRSLLDIWRDDGVIHPDDLTLLNAFVQKTRGGCDYTELTARFRTHAGQHAWCKVALTCLRNEDGLPKRYIGTINNVDEATRSILALKYRAEYDTLTGVYNMQTFYAKAAQVIREHPEQHYSIIRMDIDRFKVINDLYGLEEGDKLLCAIARLLENHRAPGDTYGRISGDIFCVCTSSSRAEIIHTIHTIVEQLAEYPLAYRIMPSFGICSVDTRDTPVNVLCDWANLALKTIKGSYLTSYAFYDEKLRQRLLGEKRIESEMHAALKNGEFVMYLQPKVHIPTSTIMGAEALVRWNHPLQGLIPPDVFVPLFEKNGFIIQLDEYIWEQACITLRAWIDSGRTPVPLSVNVSRMHIHDVHFCDKLLKLTTKYALSPSLIKLELTESAFLENEAGLLATMNNLQAHDFLFSMDDFGSGYSSLNMLKSLPINVIKIDRGFLNEVVATERGKTIIRNVITMAHQMNIRVIAEGVETVEHAVFLLESGCCLAQGFFYSRPVPLKDFEKLAYESTEAPFPLAPEILAIVASKTCME